MGGVWNKGDGSASLVSVAWLCVQFLPCSALWALLLGWGEWSKVMLPEEQFKQSLCTEPQISDFSDVYCHLTCSWILHRQRWCKIQDSNFKGSPSPLEALAWFFSSWSAWVPCVAVATAFGDGVWISAHFCWLIQCLWCEEATISRWEIDVGTQKMREGSGRIGCHSAMSEMEDKDLVCKLGSLPAGKWAFVLWDNVRAQSHPLCLEWGA